MKKAIVILTLGLLLAGCAKPAPAPQDPSGLVFPKLKYSEVETNAP